VSLYPAHSAPTCPACHTNQIRQRGSKRCGQCNRNPKWHLAEQAQPFTVEDLPSPDMPTSELLALRSKQFLRKSEAIEARKLIRIAVRCDGPIGIAHFGDPHIDDDGTNIVALQRHVAIVGATEGLFAGNSGDTTNNWPGRLARLYSEQGTTAKQAWQLAEWLFGSMRWMFAIGGNHDLWSGAGDPLKWISRQAGVLYQANGVRLNLALPSGRSVILNARHNWPGNSMFNTAHGPSRAIQRGHRDHLVTCGHLHTSGYQVLRCPSTRRISHALRIASYKTYDSYADANSFEDANIFVCPVTIIDPQYDDSDPRFITTLFDPEEGAEYLTWKRKRAGVHGKARKPS
jgi:hypothetical protein